MSDQHRRTVYTIGHSTRSMEEFILLLAANGIELLADVRTVPKSRANPQLNRETLPQSLEKALGTNKLKTGISIKKAGAFWAPAGNFLRSTPLDLFDLSGLRPLGAPFFHKTYPIPFAQGLEPSGLYSAEVNEYVMSTVSFDKPKALAVVKPFHFTFRHFNCSLKI